MMCIAEITDKQIFEVQYPNYPADLKKEVLLNKIAELKPTQKGFMLAAYDLYNLNDKASTLESCTQVTDYFGEDFLIVSRKINLWKHPSEALSYSAPDRLLQKPHRAKLPALRKKLMNSSAHSGNIACTNV